MACIPRSGPVCRSCATVAGKQCKRDVMSKKWAYFVNKSLTVMNIRQKHSAVHSTDCNDLLIF